MRSIWHVVPLGEICAETDERNGDRDLEVMSVSKNLGVLPQAQRFKKRIASADTRRYKVIYPGDFVFDPMLLWTGSIARFTGRTTGIVSPAYCTFRADKKKVNGAFLHYFLKLPEHIQVYKNISFGTNQRRQKAHFHDFARLSVPLPPLTEQERIVCLLDEAEALRKLRNQASTRMEEFVPALFHEMFGDPIKNEKNWNIAPLINLSVKFSDGPFGSNLKTSHYRDNGIRIIRLQNIGVGDFIDEDKAYISEEHFRTLIKHECLPGDVIVGTLGNPNLRACILPDYIPIALNKADCPQIRPNPKTTTSEYICWLLNLPATLKLASGLIQGQTRARISMGRLRELQVPIPPFSLQHEFAQRVQEAREIQSRQAQSAERVEVLYQSMLSRAFAGEL